MGARFTRIQPIQPVSIKDGVVRVTGLLGDVYEIEVPISLEVNNDMSEYRDDVFVNVISGQAQFVMRTDMTWSLIHNKSRLLLDIGSFKFEQTGLFFTEYIPVGFMSANGRVSSVLLDLRNKRLLHGMRGPTMSNGYDFILDEPFPVGVDISPEVSASFANTAKSKIPKLHIWSTALREVEVKYNAMARSVQI